MITYNNIYIIIIHKVNNCTPYKVLLNISTYNIYIYKNKVYSYNLLIRLLLYILFLIISYSNKKIIK